MEGAFSLSLLRILLEEACPLLLSTGRWVPLQWMKLGCVEEMGEKESRSSSHAVERGRTVVRKGVVWVTCAAPWDDVISRPVLLPMAMSGSTVLPHLGSVAHATTKVHVDTYGLVCCPRAMLSRPHLLAGPSLYAWESWPWWPGHWRTGSAPHWPPQEHPKGLGLPRLTNSATTQAHIQGFELVHTSIYLIYAGAMNRLLLKNHSYRMSLTWDNSRIVEKRLGEDPVLMV